MKKRILLCIAGGTSGIAVCQGILLIISWKTGIYSPVPPEMAEAWGLLPAATLQFFLSFLMGALYALASQVWQTDWSLTRQTAAAYLIYLSAYLCTAWICFWMDHTLSALLQIAFSFTAVFVCIWISIWVKIKRNLREMNDSLH